MAAEQMWSEGLTNADIVDAVLRSGYPLEQEVAHLLQKEGFISEPNKSFEDQDSGEAREIDIHAVKVWMDERDEIMLDHHLWIECKATSQPLVFFTKPQFPGTVPLHYVDIVGMPESFDLGRSGITDVDAFVGLAPHPERADPRSRCSQFCVIRREGKRVEANHAEVYKAHFVPLLKAWASGRVRYRETVAANNLISLCIERPILVTKSPLFIFGNEARTVEERTWIQFERQYESRTVRVAAAIDVVRADWLSSYLKIIQGEFNQFVERVTTNRGKLLKILSNKKKVYMAD